MPSKVVLCGRINGVISSLQDSNPCMSIRVKSFMKFHGILAGKPIASLSFHLEASLLAIACGHKLYIWNYDVQGSRPEIVLKTRRSMRAVHFHPHGLPVILTAEVQDPSDTAGLPITLTENGPFFFDTKSNTVGTESMEVDEGCEGERCGIEDENQEQAFRRRPSWMDGDIMSEGLVTSQIARGISNSSLPPSMVPLGWEVPFPEAVGPVLNSVPTSPGLSEDAQLAAATYASVWNILWEDPTPRVRLIIWSFNPGKYASYLDSGDRLQLEISDAVLCSEMGVHFSPCGRYLAATVSCRAPMQHQTGLCAPGNTLESRTVEWSPQHAPETQDAAQASQTTLSLPERVVFEVRIISMDGPDFGATLKAKRIRAAHCLTSVQFSPTGDHVLLAYGKKHSSLLRSLVAHQNALIPLHTILEIVNTSNMKVFRALPSGDDEINAACFHPLPGGGVAYGTKEGKLRFIEPHRVA